MKTFLEDFIDGSNRSNYPKELARTPGSIAGKVYGTQIVIDVCIDDVHLVRLRVAKSDTGQGYGGKALRWLCKLADKHNLAIALQPIANHHKALDDTTLLLWYKRHGFKLTRSVWMVRKPVKKKVTWRQNLCKSNVTL